MTTILSFYIIERITNPRSRVFTLTKKHGMRKREILLQAKDLAAIAGQFLANTPKVGNPF